MKRFFNAILLAVVCTVMSGCPDDVEEITQSGAEALIAGSILAGDIVTVTEVGDDKEIKIDGLTVAVTKSAITTGCFGIPSCVRMDEPNRGVVKSDIDDFVFMDNYATGVTYFSDVYYTPYWAQAPAAAYHAMDALIMAQGYRERRNGWCREHAAKCVVPEI